MKKKKEAGRPLAEIDWKKVENMCLIHCTGEEIAAILGIDYDTLQKAVKRVFKIHFTDYYKQKSAGGKMSLRRRQYTSAMDGNSTMLIWLGKQWLGQSDKLETTDTSPPEPKEIIFTVQDASLKPTPK